MKKIIVLLFITLFVITCLTACTDQTSESQISTVEGKSKVEDTSEELSYDSPSLIAAYCSGDWNGSFIHNAEHCASIENGQLWIDCEVSEGIPDLGAYEDCFWASVIGTNENGTWIYDRQIGTIELWCKGTRYQKIVTSYDDDFLTQVYLLANCLVARNDTLISVYSFDGSILTDSKEIIDCYQTEDSILLSNFKHQNFEVTSDGVINSLSTNYVRFPQKNAILEDVPNCCALPFNKYWNENWDGNLYVEEDTFYLIDFYGDIYINNKLVGNVNTGISKKIIEDGSNLLTNTNSSYYLDGKNLLIYQNGSSTVVDVPDGDAKILWSTDSAISILVYGKAENDNKLVIINNGKCQTISEKVSDAYVAYDCLYYLEGNKAYSLEWYNENAKPELFIEGALAISHRSDELEGAIVPSELNNMQEYGESNLYSPYGKKK